MRPLFRLPPKMPVQAYDTYQIISPIETHTRSATCQEVQCQAMANGWKTLADVGTPEGRKRANYIRLMSGRSFTFTQTGSVVTFIFTAGQQCFADHRVDIGRPAFYLRRGGDWRAVTSDKIMFNARDWVDDFANHQDRIATAVQRG